MGACRWSLLRDLFVSLSDRPTWCLGRVLCRNRYTDDNPRWTIARETLQSTLALYMRDLQEFDRGLGTG